MMVTAEKSLKITLIRSLIGTKCVHRLSIKGLGLKKLNDTVCLPDTPEIRGMISKAAYLLKIEG